MQKDLILRELYEITKENKPDFQLLMASLGRQRQALSLETLSSMARINQALLLPNTLIAVIHLSEKGQGTSQGLRLCDTRLFKINYVPVLCCQHNYK